MIAGCPPQTDRSLADTTADIHSKVEVFDVKTEQWTPERVKGSLPKGYGGASCIVPSSKCIFRYGGEDGNGESYGELLQLNLENLMWNHFPTVTSPARPLKKSGSGMVLFESRKGLFLGLFGGFGVMPRKQNRQSGSTFKEYSRHASEGWSNEFHVLDLTEGNQHFLCRLQCCSVYIKSTQQCHAKPLLLVVRHNIMMLE